MTVTYEVRRQVEECIRTFFVAGVLTGNLGNPTFASGASYPFPIVIGRLQEVQGTGVASANNLTLPLDGNSPVVSGSVQINLLDGTGWQNGSFVTLIFSGAPLIKHSQVVSGAFLPIWLNNRVDFQAQASSTLTLRRANNQWFEMGRCF